MSDILVTVEQTAVFSMASSHVSWYQIAAGILGELKQVKLKTFQCF
jgi:hypothetical protein